MLDSESTTAPEPSTDDQITPPIAAPSAETPPPAKTAAKQPATKATKRTTKKAATATKAATTQAPATKTAAKKTTAKTTAAKTTAAKNTAAKKTAAKKTAAKKTAAKKVAAVPPEVAEPAAPPAEAAPDVAGEVPVSAGEGTADAASIGEAPTDEAPTDEASADETAAAKAPAKRAPRRSTKKAATPPAPLFQAPEPVPAAASATEDAAPTATTEAVEPTAVEPPQSDQEGEEAAAGSSRRRRRRGGRRRRKSTTAATSPADEVVQQQSAAGVSATDTAATDAAVQQPAGDGSTTRAAATDAAVQPPVASEQDTAGEQTEAGTSRRRRRRRRSGDEAVDSPDDPQDTVVKVREPRGTTEDTITSVTGSTRLEAKKQRRREGRDAGRRRPPIVSEAEFLARRESVERVMVVRQRADLTQIAVLEDKVLVEHYVARESQTSLIGNVYLGRVQNVLPSMEAAFIDIGKGRNAVLYAGEVNWDVLGKDGQPRRIETALKSGQTVLVQVTKDPVGHKGARLTSQISLPGRYLVYVPSGQASGISRKLPETERNRLKAVLKEILPEDAGVIIRTAAEGASEHELRRDVARLTARWEDICAKAASGQAPQPVYSEPDLMIKVVRDLFTEDFSRLVVSGDDAWDNLEAYVGHVAPELMDRLERWDGDGDVFASYRIDEQIAKGLDRKVFLPSGGSLVIDRTEAMTVVDVNTGKFTGAGGNLEETVTKNNLEAAEEIVRQLRLRDIGGIVVVDFIDMVLESNRELVLRRLIECLGRDRTKHQVAEVTSLGLVQMTRKRVGTGLLEAFSETCQTCQGRGVVVHHEPVGVRSGGDSGANADDRRSRRSRRGGDDKTDAPPERTPQPKDAPRPRLPLPQPAAEPVPASGAAEPVAEPAAAEPVAEPVAAEQIPEPVPERAAGEPRSEPPPAAPRRSRRRAASRPAGPAGVPLTPVESG
ncbi:MAG: Rne/Rng family ribonuclease [Actinomycetota bacterium]|nr:Rne/Rng family ribonuclease [Actinomycetota bacterium]